MPSQPDGECEDRFYPSFTLGNGVFLWGQSKKNYGAQELGNIANCAGEEKWGKTT
jgi:hypothetical protein